jgi:mannose-6-phosphate isomerase-like protein (cupin superfamily)
MWNTTLKTELTNIALSNPVEPEVIEKVWGWEVVIVNNELYCSKLLILKKDHQCSLHYHIDKDETFYFLEGMCLFQWGNQFDFNQFIIPNGRSIHLPPRTEHCFSGISEITRIIEVSTFHDDDDSIRITNSMKVNNGSEIWQEYPIWCPSS